MARVAGRPASRHCRRETLGGSQRCPEDEGPSGSDSLGGGHTVTETRKWAGGDFVAAVINERNELDSALAAIQHAGFHGDEVRVFEGESGAAEIRKLGGDGFLAAVKRAAAENVGAADELLHRH